MSTTDTLLGDVERALSRPFELHHQAASVAMQLFELGVVHGLRASERLATLEHRFREQVHSTLGDDLLAHQIRYASRLATSPGKLTDEDLHKLFSICNEVHALRSLGFRADETSTRDFEDGVRRLFDKEHRRVRSVAEARVEAWSRPLWWFAENLQGGR